MVDIREYHDRGGHCPFRDWFDRLNAEAARKVTTALYRVGLGELLQRQKCWCWCLRVQDQFWARLPCIFWKRGEQTVILLGGGTKQRQQNDIKLALERWEDYKQRKKLQKKKKGNEHGFDARF